MSVKDTLKLLKSDQRPTLGVLLKQARIGAGLDQGEMAEELGYSRQAVSEYERDNQVPTRAVVIAWAVITRSDFEPLEKALAAAWFAHNGTHKRTTTRVGQATRWLSPPNEGTLLSPAAS